LPNSYLSIAQETTLIDPLEEEIIQLLKYKMKNIKYILLCFVLILCHSYAQITKAEIIATGLTCSVCSNAINKQLKSMDEVANVSTDLNTNTFTVTLKQNSTLTANTLKESVEKTGFYWFHGLDY
jgi:copper chaperone CopZ